MGKAIRKRLRLNIFSSMGHHQSKYSKAKFEEISNKTHFNVDEIKRWFDGFVSDCPTGNVTKFEFTRLYCQFFPKGNPVAFASFVFNVFDKKKVGYIDFEDFMMALSVTSRGNVEDKLDWAFDLYDLDGNGAISKEEFIAGAKHDNTIIECFTLYDGLV